MNTLLMVVVVAATVLSSGYTLSGGRTDETVDTRESSIFGSGGRTEAVMGSGGRTAAIIGSGG